MAKYNTAQRQELIDFLMENADNQYTIEEIADELARSEDAVKSVGKSTIYRLIGQMLEEGIVRRTVKGNSRQFMYQYSGGVSCSHHLHMKCRECGKILHMNDEESNNLFALLQENSNFTLDIKETLLLGQCEKCSM